MNKKKHQQEFTPLEKSHSKRLKPRLSAERSLTGFTLIETLVAITILLVAILGPLTLATRGLSASLVARDQIVAFYLAQEAIEFVRVKRDEVVLTEIVLGPTGAAWDSTLQGCINPNFCTVEVQSDIIGPCGGVGCPVRGVLFYDQMSGFYNHSLIGEESKFTRSITLMSTDTDELEIVVDMFWRTGLVEKKLTLRSIIRNIWQL